MMWFHAGFTPPLTTENTHKISTSSSSYQPTWGLVLVALHRHLRVRVRRAVAIASPDTRRVQVDRENACTAHK
jgi:hypothetical protein